MTLHILFYCHTLKPNFLPTINEFVLYKAEEVHAAWADTMWAALPINVAMVSLCVQEDVTVINKLKCCEY